MLDDLTLATFAPYLSTAFQVAYQPDRSVAVELVEADAQPTSPNYESFSLVFRGPLDAFLPQALYRFDHQTLGAFDLFIVPIRKDAHGFYYEAVFNRLRSGDQA